MRVFQFTVPADKRSAVFDSYLSSAFGGYTVVRGEGAWSDNKGKLHVEKVLIYTVATELEAKLLGTVTDFLREVGEQAAYFSEIGTAEVILL